MQGAREKISVATPRDGPQPVTGYGSGYNQADAHGGREHADGQVGHDNDPELHQVDPQGRQHGDDHGDQQDQGRRGLHKGTGDQQNQVDQQEQKHAIGGQCQRAPANRAGSSSMAAIQLKIEAAAMMNITKEAVTAASIKIFGSWSPLDLPVHRHADHQGIDDRNGSRLGGRKNPQQNAPQNNQWCSQSQKRLLKVRPTCLTENWKVAP
jgi:hypothetical protein